MERLNNEEDLTLLNYLLSRPEKSNDLSQTITDFFPGLVYVYDINKKKLSFINKKVTDILGYSYEDIRNFEDDLIPLIFKDDVEQVKKELEKYQDLEDNNAHCYHCRLNNKKGNWNYFRTHGTVLRRNDQGKPEAVLFVAEDVTEQLRSEEEISQLRQAQRELEHLLHFGTFYYDVKKDHSEWSDGLFELFGIEKDTLPYPMTLSLYYEMVEEHDQAPLKERVRQCIEEQQEYSFTYVIRTPQQQRKIVTSRGKPILNDDGVVTGIAGSILDVTEEVSKQQELLLYKRQNEEKEQFLNFGSWEENLAEGTISWSAGMYRLFGYETAEEQSALTVDQRLYEKHIRNPEQQDHQAHIQQVLNNKGSYYVWEYDILAKDGTAKRLETHAKLIRNEQNIPVKIIGTTRDITQLRQYEKNLESKVRELNRSNKELEEFAYVASHDLQEPLRKLSTFTERLSTNFSEQLGNDGKVYTSRISAAAENMRGLIDNLLEFSRVARIKAAFEKVDLNSILQKVLADLELSMEENQAEVKSDRLPVINGLQPQLLQLFNNLLSNALKFRKPDMSPRIIISAHKISNAEKETLHLPEQDAYWKISIADNGIGFEQEYAERIFLIFQRLHGKVEFPGSGVGLAICKKIVENHGGLIYAEGKIGEGAIFTIILPENHQ